MTGAREIGDDELVTLSEACEIFFNGRLTKSSLRLEAGRGNLSIVRIANKDFVTRRGINEMIARCTIAKETTVEKPTLNGMTAKEVIRARLRKLKAEQ